MAYITNPSAQPRAEIQKKKSAWCHRHHIASTKSNCVQPQSRRSYFDHLPFVRLTGGELSDRLVTLHPDALDGCQSAEPHLEVVKPRLKQFPVSRPSTSGPVDIFSPGLDLLMGCSSTTMSMMTMTATITLPSARRGRGFESLLPAYSASPSSARRQPQRASEEVMMMKVASLAEAANQPRVEMDHLLQAIGQMQPSPQDSGPSSNPSTHERTSLQSQSGGRNLQRSGSKGRPRSKLAGKAAREGVLKKMMPFDADLLDTDESKEYPKFIEWTHNNHGHLVALWQKLDLDKSMSLHRAEFSQGLRRLKYPGNIDRIWTLMDRDTTGTISFLEFAPEAALQLANFRRWALQRFGSAKELCQALDQDKSGGVNFREFIQSCKAMDLPKELFQATTTLFTFIDSDDGHGKGVITEDELHFLDVWRPPDYLWEEPNLQAANRFREAVLARHNGNALLAWKKLLDRDSSMKVSYEEFVIQCKALQKKGIAEALPQCGLEALYVAFDQERCGWFTLKEWCRETFDGLCAFVKFCKTEFASIKEFYKHAESLQVPEWDNERAEGVTYAKFSQAVRILSITREERLRLFDALSSPARRADAAKSREAARIYMIDLLFLDKWDPDKEVREVALWRAVVERSGTASLICLPLKAPEAEAGEGAANTANTTMVMATTSVP